MKLIKHGNAMRFVCDLCGCEWQAVKKECSAISLDNCRKSYMYYCPECGHGVVGVYRRADERKEPNDVVEVNKNEV